MSSPERVTLAAVIAGMNFVLTADVRWGRFATRTDPESETTVEFLTATRDGVEMSFDDLVDIYGVDPIQLDLLRVAAIELAADNARCSAEARAEARMESRR